MKTKIFLLFFFFFLSDEFRISVAVEKNVMTESKNRMNPLLLNVNVAC